MHILTIDDLKEQKIQSIKSKSLRIGVYLNEKNIMQKFFLHTFAKKNNFSLSFIEKDESKCLINLTYSLVGLIDILLITKLENENKTNEIKKHAKIPIMNINMDLHSPFHFFCVNKIFNKDSSFNIIEDDFKINYKLYEEYSQEIGISKRIEEKFETYIYQFLSIRDRVN